MGNKAGSEKNPESTRRASLSSTLSSVTSNDQQEPTSNIFKLLSRGYDELVNGIIRPPRAEYSMDDLGPAFISFGGKCYVRRDFEVQSHRGKEKMAIKCSMWQNSNFAKANEQAEVKDRKAMPCVVYLHGNASCRVAAQALLPHLLPQGINVMSFDFVGSGKSDGEYVSLGNFEKDDVTAVIAHLRKCGTVSTIAIWGHSMGAATALMFAHTDPSIAALVLDCGFADLKQVAMEMTKHAEEAGFKVPKALAHMAYNFIKGSIKKKAKFNISDVKPIKHVHEAFIPALFAVAKHDEVIDPHHSYDLYTKYGSEDKNIIEIGGSHCSPRPRFFYHSAVIFLKRRMCFGTGFTEADDKSLPKDTSDANPYPADMMDTAFGTGAPGFGYGGFAQSMQVSPMQMSALEQKQLDMAIRASLGGDPSATGGGVDSTSTVPAGAATGAGSGPSADTTFGADADLQRALQASLATAAGTSNSTSTVPASAASGASATNGATASTANGITEDAALQQAIQMSMLQSQTTPPIPPAEVPDVRESKSDSV